MADSAPVPKAGPRTRGHLRSYPPQRCCAVAECATVLSRYNASDLCWSHEATAHVRSW